MAIFNIHEAKTHFSRLVEDAAAGKEVVIAKSGKPVARLVSISAAPVSDRPRRKLGLLAGQWKVPDDYNAPLPDEVLASFELGDLMNPSAPDESS